MAWRPIWKQSTYAWGCEGKKVENGLVEDTSDLMAVMSSLISAVPFHNNGSEIAVSEGVLKRKISSWN